MILSGIIFSLIALYVLAASFFNWDSFFNNKRVLPFAELFGRKTARIIYAVLGAVILFCAVILMFAD